MDKIKIYLAGPMFECDHEEMHGWRDKLIKDYSAQVDFIDPTGHIMQDESDSDSIVEMDKEAIEGADFVLAHTWKSSAGTSMEIHYAFNEGIPVYVVSNKRESGWVQYHAKGAYDNFIDAMGDIFDAFAWEAHNCSGDCGRVEDVTGKQMHNIDCPAFELPEEDFSLGHLSDPSPDLVNHPPHYTAGGIETKDFIRAKGLGYNLGNAVKYITRSGKKSGACPVEDLKKAVFYLNDEIENMEK